MGVRRQVGVCPSTPSGELILSPIDEDEAVTVLSDARGELPSLLRRLSTRVEDANVVGCVNGDT